MREYNKLASDFASIGSRVKLANVNNPDFIINNFSVVIINSDRTGEYFQINFHKDFSGNIRVARITESANYLVLAASNGRQYICGKVSGRLFIKEIFNSAENSSPIKYDFKKAVGRNRHKRAVGDLILPAIHKREAYNERIYNKERSFYHNRDSMKYCYRFMN